MTDSQSNHLTDYRRMALMSLWIGLITMLGITFVFIPNIELVLLSAFLGGTFLGPRHGLIVAVLGEALFSAMNPIGSGLGFPILFALQVIVVGLVGMLGGFFMKIYPGQAATWIRSGMMGLSGLTLTLMYDVVTALSLPLSTGITEGTIMGTLIAGIAFMSMHVVSNTAMFAIFGPGLIDLIQDQLAMHRLGMDHDR